MIFCSGVLYYMPDPVDLIRRMSLQTDKVFLWTHYVGEESAKPWEPNFPYNMDGFLCTYYRYVYDPVMRGRSYAGSEQFASRVAKETILDALRHYGFTEIVISLDEPGHPGGPAFSLTAAKTLAP